LERLRRWSLAVGSLCLLAILPSLWVAGLAEQPLTGQTHEPLAWQPGHGPAQTPGAEPRRAASLPCLQAGPPRSLWACSGGADLAGRRAFLASRRGAEDIPLAIQVLFRRMGGADDPDSPQR